jgi:hypothetical protein
MNNGFIEFCCCFVLAISAVAVPVVGLVAVDYFISAEATVNAVNTQCGTQYEQLDYLRISQTAMLQMCETRQKRIELR